MKRAHVVGGLAALTCIAGGVALVLELREDRFPFAEAIEVLGTPDVRTLRSPLRPIRGTDRVLVFALDGVGHGAMLEAIRAGRMPHLSALLGAEIEEGTFAHGAAVPNVLSVLPSVTIASWSAVYTGLPPAWNGIPGNEWLVPETGAFYAPTPMSVEDSQHAVQMVTDGLVNQQLRAPTLFETLDLRVHVSLSPVWGGADVYTIPSPGDLDALLADVVRALPEGEEAAMREAASAVDRHSIDSVLAAVARHGVPDLQVVYFPGTDLYTHVAPSPEADQQAYLADTIDPALGRVLEAWDAAGVLERTAVVLISDHGHTACIADESHALGEELGGTPADVLTAVGYRVRPFRLGVVVPPAYDAAMAFQGPFSWIYLADRSRCPGGFCDWRRPPRFEEDVLPVLRAYHLAATSDPANTGLQPALDLVMGRRRTAEVPAPPFEVFDGERLIPLGEWLAAHPRPELLRLEERLDGLAVGPYGHLAGDVLLLTRFGEHLPIEERYYLGFEYSSTHGGAGLSDSNQLLIVARRSASGSAVRAEVEAVLGPEPSGLDIAPLLRHLLNAPPEPTATPR